MELGQGDNIPVFLHAHLQVVYYNCVKFHKNSISRLGGVALTRYMPPPPFRESISWIISPFKFWTATTFLHAHLQVVHYNWVKLHKTPISRLGGVALTRYMDGRTDRVIPIYPPPPPPPQTLFAGGIIKYRKNVCCDIYLCKTKLHMIEYKYQLNQQWHFKSFRSVLHSILSAENLQFGVDQ
jgi:hypothetical protein